MAVRFAGASGRRGGVLKNDLNALRFALRIISGKNIFNFGFQESLRTFLNPFFTGRAVEGSAALAQQAALQMPFSSTTPLVKMRLERSAERDKREI